MLSIPITADNIQTEKLAYEVVNRFFFHYLTERSVEKTLDAVADDVFSIGTGEGEVAMGKEAFRQLLEAEMAALSAPIGYEIYNFHAKWNSEQCFECFCCTKATVALSDTGQALSYTTRLTASFRREGTGFLAQTLHMSEASSYQESDEFFPIKFVADQMNRLNKEAQHDLLEMMSDIMPGGVLGGYLEEDFPLYIANDRFLSMIGYTFEEFMEFCQGYLIHTIHPDDRDYVWHAVQTQLAAGPQYEIEYRMRKHDGSYFWVHDVGRTTITDEGRTAIISLVIDISEQVRTREQLKDESLRDPLTNLYNRKGGAERIGASLLHTPSYLFFMVDVDNFKQINDNYGHAAGDDALKFLTGLLGDFFRKTDVLCRMGGDEFAVYAPNCQDLDTIAHKIEVIMDTYHGMVQARYPLSKSSLSVGGVFSSTAHTFEELYKMADDRLYQVKACEKGRIRLEKV